MPTTFGTATGFGPEETLIRTDAPAVTTTPGRGSCAVTTFGGRSEGTDTTFASRPLVVSSATAASRDSPTREGTVTFGFPLDTRIVTSDPFGSLVPSSGSCS